MDNRWRFLYCGMTELWGHVRKAEAGNGKPGASGVPVTLALLIVVAMIRELLGSGSWFGVSLLQTVNNGGWYVPNGLLLLPPSAFFIIGLVIWVLRSWKTEQQESTEF